MKQQNFRKKKTYAFRQWTRKNYAVFNSLALLIKISVMSVAYSLVNPLQETQAQSDTVPSIKKIELDEVEVSGQRAPVVYSQIARVISVVKQSEIEQAPAQSANDLLKYVPQVDIRQRGVNGIQADIAIQGGSFDQTLILLNGINLTDPQTGHHNLNLPVVLESIDRIEILKGPASRVFGTNAFSGAVNFITGQDTSNHIKASLAGGDFGLYRAAFCVNQHSEKLHNFLAVSKDASNGYTQSTNYEQLNAFYQGSVCIKKSNIELQTGVTKKDFGANSFYSPKFPNQFEATQTYFLSINGETGNTLKLLPAVYWRRNYDHYILERNNPKLYQNFHYTDVYGANLNSYFQTKLGKTSVGIEYRKEILYSTNLGPTTDHSKKTPQDDSIRYTHYDYRENLGAYLEQNIHTGKFASSSGLLINQNTKFNEVGLYPGIDLSYNIHENIRWYTSVNRSLRLPSFTDLYYKGPQNRGNPFLKPEHAWTIESGFKFNRKIISGNCSYFHRWGSNIIDWIKYPHPDSIWFTTNYTTLNTDGVELSLVLKPNTGNIAFFSIDNVSFSYTFINVSKKQSGFQSYYALDNLKNKVVLGLTGRVWKNFGFTWLLSWKDRDGTYSKYYSENKTSVETPYEPFFLLDGKIYYKNRVIKVFIEATNLLNEYYFDIGNIPQPGRWFKAGFDVLLGW